MNYNDIAELKAELAKTIRLGTLPGSTVEEMAAAHDRAVLLETRIKDLERDAAIRSIGREEMNLNFAGPGGAFGSDLGSALLAAGFNLKTQPSATVPIDHALRLKAGSLDGGSSIEDAVPYRFTPAPLGIDNRYLFPHVPTTGVGSDVTGVSTYRQLSRTLASPGGDSGSDGPMIRDITDTSAKPETDTSAEVVSAPLKQVATVSSNTPNTLLQNTSFRGWVNNDLLAAYRAALDFHIVTELQGAGIGSGPGGGANTFEDILYAQETVRAAGYVPDIVVVSPNDSLGIQLTMLHSGDSYAFSQAAPTFVVTNAVGDGEGFVADASSLGTLFLSPFSLAVFEENAGSTNSSTVRAESNGLFVCQRPDAAATISATS